MLFPLSVWIFLHRWCVCLQPEESGSLFNMHLKSATLICDSNWITDHNNNNRITERSKGELLFRNGRFNVIFNHYVH